MYKANIFKIFAKLSKLPIPTIGNSKLFLRKVFGFPILSICTKSIKLKKDVKVFLK